MKNKTDKPEKDKTHITRPNEPLMNYLEIRNWDKFQSRSKTGKSLPWCKVYSAQADDFEYQRLTAFQRGVLHDCYLVVTRTARNLHNDITWLARTMHTQGTDRPHLYHAIDTLVSRGFLTPTESANLTCESEKESEKEHEKERESESEAQRPEKKTLVLSRPLSAKEKLEAVAADFKAKRQREREGAQ